MEWHFCVWCHKPRFAASAAYLTSLGRRTHVRSTLGVFRSFIIRLAPYPRSSQAVA